MGFLSVGEEIERWAEWELAQADRIDSVRKLNFHARKIRIGGRISSDFGFRSFYLL